MKVFEWLEATNPNKKGISMSEKMRLIAMRKRVFDQAGTNAAVLAGAKTRKSIGRRLTERLANATQSDKELQNSPFVIRWEDEAVEVVD